MSAQNHSSSLLIDQLCSGIGPSILCYPRPYPEEVERRVEELRSLDVTTLLSEGRTEIGGFHVLGKGCVSIAIKALIRDTAVALKVRRIDANRPSMEREVCLQRIANSVDVGPKLFTSSDNFIAMDLGLLISSDSWRGVEVP